MYDGKCTWYKPDGTVEKEMVYQNGQASISTSFDATGMVVKKSATYKTVALPISDIVVNSTGRAALGNGYSKILYRFNLPAGTVKWFYEFSANRTDVDKANIRSKFEMAATLSRLVDESGLLAASINALGRPPGSNYCDVYVMNGLFGQAFATGQRFSYKSNASQLNFSSGVMEVNDATIKDPVIGISNNDAFYGINVTIQVVAIVAEL